MYGLSGQWSKSVKILADLLERDSENHLLTEAYAYALVASGDLAAGLNLYEKIALSDENNPVAQINYLRLLIAAGHYEVALAKIEEARLRFKTSPETATLNSLEKTIEDLTKDSTKYQSREFPKN